MSDFSIFLEYISSSPKKKAKRRHDFEAQARIRFGHSKAKVVCVDNLWSGGQGGGGLYV
jgi:hypothetical protein